MSSSLPKYVAIGSFQANNVDLSKFPIIACYLYVLWIDGTKCLSLVWKLGLHPSTLARLSHINSGSEK